MNSYIFDVDGTIWDSTEVCARAYNAAIYEWKSNDRSAASRAASCSACARIITPDDLKKVFGSPMDVIRDTIFADFPPEAREWLAERTLGLSHELLSAEPPKPYAGVRETLEYLRERGCQLFIVSNCEEGYIPIMLEGTGLAEYFTEGISRINTNSSPEKVSVS